MFTEVVLKNEAGWSLKQLQEFRGIAAVASVDGRGLLKNGRFREAVVRFRKPQEAAYFAKLWLAATGKKRTR